MFDHIVASLSRVRVDLAWGAVLMVVSFVGSIALVTLVVTRLPEDYFLNSHKHRSRSQSALVRWAATIARNVIGVSLIALGIIMSIPGIPGQGILTILVGLLLVDLPGKRRAERWIMRRPRVLRSINSIRKRFKKAPLRLDEPV